MSAASAVRHLSHRVIRRSKRALRELSDIRLRQVLSVQPRPQRTPVVLDGLLSGSGLVVMAHPDDEAISAGMLLAKLSRAGVICVTDGAPRHGSFVRNAGFDNWMDYAVARRGEAEAALALLGRDISPMRNLGIADQEAAFNLAAAARNLARTARGFSHIITHAYEGGHPDHDSTAFCVHAACALIAKDDGTPPVIVEAPLYSSPRGGAFVHNQFVPHGDAGPVVSFTLSPAEQDLKRRMFDCHTTQSSVFAPFDVTEEKFRQAPRYHFAAPPHVGDVGYNQYMGPFTGRVWRRQAWRAMRELDLLQELA